MIKIHIRFWRTWEGPVGNMTQTGPITFFRPQHYYICSEFRDNIDGEPHQVGYRGGRLWLHPRWYKACAADDYTKVGC